jgi:hypothetical protein
MAMERHNFGCGMFMVITPMDSTMTPLDMKTCLLKTDRTSNDTKVSSIVSHLDNAHIQGLGDIWIVAYPDPQFNKDAVIICLDGLDLLQAAMIPLVLQNIEGFNAHWTQMQAVLPESMMEGEEDEVIYNPDF